MPDIELIIALVLASSVLAGLARVLDVHYAIVLVLGGLALGFVPGIPAPRVEPDLIFLIFLPPLIYAAAFGSSTMDLRANVRPIGLLAIGLVIVTIAGVAVVAHVAAGVGWGPAVVLGAVLGPTDPVVATSVLRRVGARDRISTILEGEALVNDGTGLTIYKIAVTAVASGAFSVGSGVVSLVIALAGVLIGLAAAWVSVEIRRRIDEPPIEVCISLLTAYLAYIPADRIGSSGILAAVAAGLYTGRRGGAVLSAPARLQMLGFWEVMTFLLESVLFLLIGLQLKRIVGDLHANLFVALVEALAVVAALVVIRMAWMFAVPALLRLGSLWRVPRGVWRAGMRAGRRDSAERVPPERSRRDGSIPDHSAPNDGTGPAPDPSPPDYGEKFVLGWSGMRGAVSLAAALAIPLTARGQPFPDRDLLIFLAFVTIVLTLSVPGLTLPALVRRLGIGEEEETARAEARARIQLAHAALQRIEDAAERERLSDSTVAQLRAAYESRIHRLEPQADGDGDGGGDDDTDRAWRLRRLHRDLVVAERDRLRELRREGEISADSQRRIQRDLDLEESRIGAGE